MEALIELVKLNMQPRPRRLSKMKTGICPKLLDSHAPRQTHHLALQRRPKVRSIKVATKLWIQIHNVDIPFGRVAYDGAIEVASRSVLLDIDAQAAVDTEFESGSCTC